jgi:polysaccharide biosynthesis/export protein
VGTGSESGDYRKVRVTRGDITRHFDIYALLSSGDLKRDPLLQDGDVIYVPPVERSYVYVLGEVKTSQVLEIADQRTSLAQVLMTSGGVNQASAKASRVYVIRGKLEKPEVFQLNANAADALLLADAFQMQPRDVVYVAEANISRWNRFLSQLIPTVQSLLAGVVTNNQLSK